MGQRGHRKSRGLYFSMEKDTKIINKEQVFFVHHRIISAVKTVEFVSDRTSYIVLRSRWRNIIVLNVHAPSKEKSDDSRDNEGLVQVFYHFPKYHMKILLGDFNAKLGRQDIFIPTIGNENLHHERNDNGFRTVNFAT